MATDRREQVKQLFAAALHIPAEQRDAVLDLLEPSLREEVESLLASHEEADSFLEEPVTITRPPDSDTTEAWQIGPYRILQEIGQGGMGVVYEAEQEKPVHRKVALKLIKWGMDTKSVIARFESERQALALMNHPNIASVYDAGATEQGRPFFAMELVRGEPISDYCDKNRLTIKERLGLFIQICEGVQHAHQKGVIHRDIKPSNILITIQGDKSVPKIIDFGVAKATSQRLTERTVYTELGQLIGTPEYMSPEQAEMTGIDIDTRTDVYSLGVVLYELLVGAQPFDAKTLREAGFDDMRRKIREEEPPKPSTRLSRLGEPSSTAAKNRSVELRSLERELHGDLDWITMKALQKDRTRRYGTPLEFAADIRRHIRHEPVVAGPPSQLYTIRKFVQRHRVGVAAAMTVFLALLAGIAGTTIGLIRAKRAEQLASEEATKASHEASKAKAINEFLQEIVGSANPRYGLGRDVTLAKAVDEATKRIDQSFRDNPEINAAVRDTIGRTYLELARYDEAESMLRSALEIRMQVLSDRHPDLLKSYNVLALLSAYRGDLESAEQLFRETLSKAQNLQGKDRLVLAETLNDLGVLMLRKEDHQAAQKLLRESLSISRDIPGAEREYSNTLHNLAYIVHQTGDLDAAETMFREALGIGQKLLGKEHTDVAMTMTLLANVLYDKGDYEAAENLHRDAVAMEIRLLGDSHPNLVGKLESLAIVLMARENYPEAEQNLLVALDIQRQRPGDFDERTRTIVRRLLELYEAWGKPEKAAEYRVMLTKEESE